MLIPVFGSSQSSCNTAVMQSSNTAVEYNMTNTEYWIQFSASSDYLKIQMYTPNSTPYAQISSVELYSGNCSSLNLLSSMNINDSVIFESNLSSGNTYYLKVTQAQATSSFIGIILSVPVNNVPINCPTSCNLVPNGCFSESNVNVDLMSYFNATNPNQIQKSVYTTPLFPYGAYNSNLSNVCGWFRTTSSSQLKREWLNGNWNYYIYLQWKAFGIYSWSENVTSVLNNNNNITSDNYILRFKHKDYNHNMDKVQLYLSTNPTSLATSVMIANKNVTTTTWKQEEMLINIPSNWSAYKYLIVKGVGKSQYINGNLMVDDIQLLSFSLIGSPSTICEGDNATLSASLCGDICEDNMTPTYLWSSSPSDPSLTGQETQPTINVTPSVTTTYTATVTTNLGTIISKSKIITVNPTPDIPVFTGDEHSCNITSTYNISKVVQNATYFCTLYDDNNNPLINPNVIQGSFTINWNNYIGSSHWTIKLDVSYNTGCSNSYSIDVFPCCLNGTTYTDQTVSGSINGGVTSFNGVITIPSGTSLDINSGAQVLMGGNAKIVLEQGASLIINSSIIEACGDNLWDGIFIEYPTSALNISQSQIYDAKNAIVSKNGGQYNLVDDEIGRSYNSLKVSNYTGNHPGIINNVSFQGANSLLYPYQNSKSNTAIDLENLIKNTDLIKIGSIYARSNISGFVHAISSRNSDFVAFALDIDDCDNGISILGNDIDPSNRRAIIGSSDPTLKCFLNNITYYCVNSEQKTDLYIYNCESTNSGNAIDVQHNMESNISILNNSFNNTGQGITVIDVSSEVYIQNNDVTLSNNPSMTLIGIKVTDNIFTGGLVPTTYICDNIINYPIYGIIANNAYDLKIINNNINLHSTPTLLSMGIINTGNSSPEIGDNQIHSPITINLNSSMVYLRNGIYSNLSDYGRYINNESVHNGAGLYFRSTLTNSEIGLNKMIDNWDGIYFENADIGPNSQGQANDPWNNEWAGNIHANMDGTLNPVIDWYHQNGVPFDPFLGASNLSTANLIPTQNGTYNPKVNCIAGPINPPGGVTNDLDAAFMAAGLSISSTLSSSQLDSVRIAKLGGIINLFIPISQSGSLSSSSISSLLSNASIYQNNSNAVYNKSRAVYRYLSDNNSYLILGTANDKVFQGIYSWLDNSNIGKLNKIEKAIFKGDTATALFLLTSLAPQNYIEIVSYEVYNIYNRSWAIGSYSFTSADSATLQTIAYQDPANGGPSVYLARNMLGLTLIDFGQNSVARMANTAIVESETEEVSNILVYPNPATDQINIEFEKGVENNNYEITIFNIFGQKIIHQQLDGNTKYSLNISELKAGMYFYTIVSDENILKSDKFIKQ